MSSELYLSIGDGKSPQHDSLVTVPTRLEIKASPAMHRSLRAHVEQVCDVSLIDEPMNTQMDVVGHVVMRRADHKMHSQPLHILIIDGVAVLKVLQSSLELLRPELFLRF